MKPCHKCGEPATNTRGKPVCDRCRVVKNRPQLEQSCQRCGGAFRLPFRSPLCHKCKYAAKGKPKNCLDCGTPVDRRAINDKCRTCLGKERSGDKAAAWTGGRTIHKASGYVLIKMPDHPNARADGYVREHVLVASLMLGRPLYAHENVHHLNHDKTDNRPENLQVMTRAEHSRHHDEDRERDEQGRFKPNGLT